MKERKSVYQCKMTGEEKIRTIVYIPKELWQEVSDIATKIYGVQRGAISYAIEDALSLWLLKTRNENSNFNFIRRDTRSIYIKVLNAVRLTQNDLSLPKRIPHPNLLKCVMKALNVKERSALSWIFKFYSDELIKPYTPTPIQKITIRKPSDVSHVKFWDLTSEEELQNA